MRGDGEGRTSGRQDGMHEAQEEKSREVRAITVYETSFGMIEFPHMSSEKADGRYRAMVTREWFLCGDWFQAQMNVVEPRYLDV